MEVSKRLSLQIEGISLTPTSPRGICKTLEESKQWMSGILPENNPGGLNYAVFTRPETSENSEPMMVGIVGVHRPSPKAELGYIYHPSSWGRGYATEALAAFLKLFWELRSGVETMEAYTDYENYASMKVLTKCGFHETRRLKEEVLILTKGPEKRDVVMFEIKAPVALY
jgi:RimJ/RimL family protein N-acetyltransferase